MQYNPTIFISVNGNRIKGIAKHSNRTVYNLATTCLVSNQPGWSYMCPRSVGPIRHGHIEFVCVVAPCQGGWLCFLTFLIFFYSFFHPLKNSQPATVAHPPYLTCKV